MAMPKLPFFFSESTHQKQPKKPSTVSKLQGPQPIRPEALPRDTYHSARNSTLMEIQGLQRVARNTGIEVLNRNFVTNYLSTTTFSDRKRKGTACDQIRIRKVQHSQPPGSLHTETIYSFLLICVFFIFKITEFLHCFMEWMTPNLSKS